MWLKRDAQVAAKLRELISTGNWGEHLPGYRKLGQLLKVNRETIEKALEILEEEGVLAPSEACKRRRILQSTAMEMAAPKPNLLVIGARPLHEFPPLYRSVFNTIFQRSEGLGWNIVYQHFDFESPRRAVRALERSISDHAASRALLMAPTEALARWMTTAPIPAYAIGGEIWTVRDRVCSCGVFLSQIVGAAAQLLWDKGHRRFLIPTATDKRPMWNTLIEDSLATWAQDIPRKELEAMFPNQGDCLPDVMKGFWPKHFASLRPTAVIVKDSFEFISLLSYCYRRGIRIPEDLSVVQLAGDASSPWFDPVPERFDYPLETLCRKIMIWLEHPASAPIGFEKLESVYHKGTTVDFPRKE